MVVRVFDKNLRVKIISFEMAEDLIFSLTLCRLQVYSQFSRSLRQFHYFVGRRQRFGWTLLLTVRRKVCSMPWLAGQYAVVWS